MNCFKMRGKKGDEHFDPLDPPRCRANKRRGRGTYENDRPPVLGVVGRESGQVRLRVVMDTKAITLEKHVHQFTLSDGHIYTDEYDSYNGIERTRSSVQHGIEEWARGRAYATSCVLFVACIRNTFQVMSLFMNAGSI